MGGMIIVTVKMIDDGCAKLLATCLELPLSAPGSRAAETLPGGGSRQLQHPQYSDILIYRAGSCLSSTSHPPINSNGVHHPWDHLLKRRPVTNTR